MGGPSPRKVLVTVMNFDATHSLNYSPAHQPDEIVNTDDIPLGATTAGEPRRVARRLERVADDDGRRLVVLAAAGSLRPHRHDHVGPHRPDEADVVADDLIASPALERLLEAEGVAEIDGAGEVLLGAVELVHRHQLRRPQHAERVAELGADLVLASVAPGGGCERGSNAEAAIEHHEQAVVLVVGMRDRLHEDAHRLQLTNGEAQAHDAVVTGEALLGGATAARQQRRGSLEQDRQDSQPNRDAAIGQELEARLQACTKSGPMVMVGTKCPSMMSMWSQSAPADSQAAISSAR